MNKFKAWAIDRYNYHIRFRLWMWWNTRKIDVAEKRELRQAEIDEFLTWIFSDKE